MENLTNENEEINNDEVMEEMQTDSFAENLIRQVIKGYQDAWNRTNKEYEIKYFMTITTHKNPMPDGSNKDVGYLRIERAIRKVDDDTEAAWSPSLIHQELHVFNNVSERVNPKNPWKENLFVSALGRLIGAGLEYAELLRRMKNTDLKERREQEENKLGLEITSEMPRPLSVEDIQYKERMALERTKAGIK